MATSNKVVIPSYQFPPVDEKFDSYFLRYRVVSEDKNSFSAWSPICEIPTYAVIQGDYRATGEGKVFYVANSKQVSSSWPLIEGISEYDVWYKWQGVGIVDAEPINRAEFNFQTKLVTYTTIQPHGFKIGDIIVASNLDGTPTSLPYQLEDYIITSTPTKNTLTIKPNAIFSAIPAYIGTGNLIKQNWIYKGRVSGNKLDFYQENEATELLFSIRIYVPHNPISHNDNYLIYAKLNHPTNYGGGVWYTLYLGDLMSKIPLPDRGQPLDVTYIYEIVNEVNDLRNLISSATDNYAAIKVRDVGIQRSKTAQVKINAGYFDITNNETVTANTTKSFNYDFDGMFKYPPIVTATVVNNNANQTSGDDVSVVIRNTTTSKVEGVVKFLVSGPVTASVNIIAIGVPA